MLENIKYNIDSIERADELKLARIGGSYLLSPITTAIIYYCKLCGISKIKDDNEINELWFRMNYVRNFNVLIYPTPDGKPHVFEPYFSDLQRHKGLFIDEMPYIERKRWINAKLDFFITENRQISESAKEVRLNSVIAQERDDQIIYYIQDQTGIKNMEPAPRTKTALQNQNQQHKPNVNTEASSDKTVKPAIDRDGDAVPDLVVQHHNEIQLKIALERAANNLPLNADQKKLYEAYQAKMLEKHGKKPTNTTNPGKPDKTAKKIEKPVKKISKKKK